MSATEPQNPLEDALANATGSDESRLAFLDLFMRSRITVVLDRPWDGRSLPSLEMRLLFVTDGSNHEQPMLALFTNETLANAVIADVEQFKHPVEVDAAWAMLGVFESAGAVINPNSTPNFRISPEVATVLREAVQARQSSTWAPPTIPDPIQ
jgi:hypothetical protein